MSAAQVAAGTPLIAAGLSPRALSAAEDQLGVSTVGELVKIPAARVQRLRGVGLGPRNELVRRAREWRQQLQVAEQAPRPPRLGRLPRADPGALSLDAVARTARAQRHRQQQRRGAGNPADTGPAGWRPAALARPAWAPQAEIAAQTGLSQPYVGSCSPGRGTLDQERPAVTALRATVREILDRHGRVMEAGQLAAALLAERGCALGDAGARLAVAQACLRAAIETEERLENPRLAHRRAGDKVLMASVLEGDPNAPAREGTARVRGRARPPGR